MVRRLNYREFKCLFVIKKYVVSLLDLSNNTKYHRTKIKKDTLQNLESARKVRIKVAALSIASPSTILVTRELER